MAPVGLRIHSTLWQMQIDPVLVCPVTWVTTWSSTMFANGRGPACKGDRSFGHTSTPGSTAEQPWMKHRFPSQSYDPLGSRLSLGILSYRISRDSAGPRQSLPFTDLVAPGSPLQSNVAHRVPSAQNAASRDSVHPNAKAQKSTRSSYSVPCLPEWSKNRVDF